MLDLILFSILLFVIVLPLGRRIFSIFITNTQISFLEKIFVIFGIGAGFLALAVLCIGMFGALYKWLIILVLAIVALFLKEDMKNTIVDARAWFSSSLRLKLSFSEKFLLILLCVAWFFTLIGSLSPILGTDALSYHMQDAKVFVKWHKISHIPYTRDSLWPFLIQMLFTLGLLLKGAVFSKLFHFAFAVFSILGIYVICRRYWPRKNSILACAAFALMPAVLTDTTYAYTDMGVVFYTLLAFYCLFVWLDSKSRHWLYLSAVACGFLLGIKITSATVTPLVILIYLFYALKGKQRLRSIFITIISFMGIAIALSGAWYLRSWVVLGNPIFPFASYIFGHGYPEKILRYHTITEFGIGLRQFITILWYITMHPAKFGGESIGPLFLVFLPMLIFIRKTSKFIRRILFISFALYTAWFFTFQYIRFFLPVLAFFSMLISYIYFEICQKEKFISKISGALLFIIFCYSANLSIYHNLEKLPVAVGLERQSHYLLRREPTFVIAEYINKNLPGDAKILSLGEVRLFYFDRDIAVATTMELDLKYNKNIKFRGSFDDYLRKENFKYLLYVEDKSKAQHPSPMLSPKDVFVDNEKEVIKETNFNYRDESYEYKLWKIGKRT